MLLTVFKAVLLIAGLIFTLIGLFIAFHIARPQKYPADTSNRINKIRLIWFALTREELFVTIFPWLSRDELDNVTSVILPSQAGVSVPSELASNESFYIPTAEEGDEFIRKQIINILYQQFGSQTGVTVDGATSFTEALGADSLDVAELIVSVELEFGINIPWSEVTAVDNVNDIVSLVKLKLKPVKSA